jgi:hypothetical protein
VALEEKRPQRRASKRSTGASPLTEYRLYFLEGAGTHISLSHEFEAEDDERAIRISESWREGRGAELWTGSRKVKAWESDR